MSDHDWVRLQRKIFTRWTNQKLQGRNMQPIDDVVRDLGQPGVLASLIEALSEKTVPISKTPIRFQAQKIEQVARTLDFMFKDCNVKMSLKPSAENLIAGDEKDALALVWALMSKYMRFDEDSDDDGGAPAEDQLSAKDALLRWVQFHLHAYATVDVTNFKKSFHDGMAFCAILHKFRPKMIPFSTLSPHNARDNLLLAFRVAEDYFGLEQYLTPEELMHLDEKAMIVYVSEYYHGLNRAHKVDLAARRITKVLNFEKTNDEMRKRYVVQAKSLASALQPTEQLLENILASDNTLRNAQSRVDRFSAYKTQHKAVVFSAHLEIDALYRTLSTRLTDHGRAPFVPEDPLLRYESLDARVQRIKEAERCEAELFRELRRQLRLHQLFKQHSLLNGKMTKWIAAKQAYVAQRDIVESVGVALHDLKVHDAFEKELASVQAGSVAKMARLGAELVQERFEWMAQVETCDAAVRDGIEHVVAAGLEKKPILEDNLAREEYKAATRLKAKMHADVYDKLSHWIDERRAYLDQTQRAIVLNVAEAQLQLSLLDAHERTKGEMTETRVQPLKDLGEAVRAAEYTSVYSQWCYEHVDDVDSRERTVDDAWLEFDGKAVTLRAKLDDDLARERFKADWRLAGSNHRALYDRLAVWTRDRLAEVHVVVDVTDSRTAQFYLAVLGALEASYVTVQADVNELVELGSSVTAARYASTLSNWEFEDNAGVTSRVSEIHTETWPRLAQDMAEKRARLEDDLARNTHAERVRLLGAQHTSKYEELRPWIAEKLAYGRTVEEVLTSMVAQEKLDVVAYVEKEIASLRLDTDAQYKLGAAIDADRYRSDRSEWVYEQLDAVMAHDDEIRREWAALEAALAHKRLILEDDHSRWLFAEKVRLEFDQYVAQHEQLEAWIVAKHAYATTKEEVHDSNTARQKLSVLGSLESDLERVELDVETQSKLCARILEARYESTLSSWVFEQRDRLGSLDESLSNAFAALSEATEEKQAVLEDDLARELFAESVRLQFDEYLDRHGQLRDWIVIKDAYARVKEEVHDSHVAQQKLSVLATLESDETRVRLDVEHETVLCNKICTARYATERSSWDFEEKARLKKLDGELTSAFAELVSVTQHKRAILDDDLQREKYAEAKRLLAGQHRTRFQALDAWLTEKLAYARVREENVDSIVAQRQLSVLAALQTDQERVEHDVDEQNKLGAKILASVYETRYSRWVYEKCADVSGFDETMNEKWETLSMAVEEKQEVLEDDLALWQFAERTRLVGEQHIDRDKQMGVWLALLEGYAARVEEIVSSDAAKLRLSAQLAKETERRNAENDVERQRSRAAELYAAEYKSERSSWRYEQRDDVHARLGRLNARWSALSEALVEKRAVLEDALARWLYIEETQLLHGQYKVAHSQLCAWAMAKEAFLGAPVTIASVSDARYHLSTLGEFDTELRMVTDASLKTVQSLNVTILARKYASERSTYVYEDRVRLLEEDTLLKTRWGRLGADSAALRLRLDEALALEERKEALRLEYAFSASTFERFATDTIALVGMDLNEDEANPFGSTLVEVEAAGVVIEQDVGETTTRANALEEAYSRAAGQLKELGETPTSNPYTSVVLEDLMAQRSAMNDALDAREDAFDVELDRHLRHDALCEKFARTAVPLVDKLDGAFKMLTGTGTTPEEQLARVDELLGSAAQDSAVLPRLTELQREMDEIGVGVNVHTTLSGSDVQARWDQHRSLILQKGEILKQEIEYKQLRGVTKEQFDEIGNIFAVYDRDRSGYIDHKELKACLFSCGEEKTRAQIAEYIRDYGVDGKIAFERFQELMINLLGDLSDTESSLMDGFVLLANGRKTISDRVLLRYVDNDDLVAYFCRVAPRVGEAAYDYARWVQQTQ